MKSTDVIYAEKIAEEYSPKSASRVVALKKLDRRAKQPAEIFAYTFGIIGALVLGVGMCLSMGVIGAGTLLSTAAGVIIGVIGIAMVCADYPIYKKLLESGKRKYAFEITELARQITDSETVN